VDATEIAVTTLAVLLASCALSTVGFGFALLAVPLMALVLPTEDAVVLSVSLALVTTTVQAVHERAHRDRTAAGRLLVGAAAGAPVGLVVLLVFTSRQLQFVLVGVISAFLVVSLRGWHVERDSRALDVGAGFASGLFNTAVAVNGPPLVMALHARHLPPPSFRSTIATVFAVSNAISAVLFAASGRYDGEVVALLPVSVPALALGYLAGVRLRRRFGVEGFRRLVLWVLAFTGVVTLLSALGA